MYASEDWTIRKQSVQSAAAIAKTYPADISVQKRSKDFLIGAAKDEHFEIQIEAVRALAPMIKDTDVALCIRTLCLPNEAANVRWAAISALSSAQDMENADIFVSAFANRDRLIREAAVKGMVNIPDSPAMRSRLVPMLASALKDSAANVRITALEGLTFTDERLYPLISDFFSRKTSQAQITAALKAIDGYRLDVKTREKIIELLTHTNSNIRILALRALKTDENLAEAAEDKD